MTIGLVSIAFIVMISLIYLHMLLQPRLRAIIYSSPEVMNSIERELREKLGVGDITFHNIALDEERKVYDMLCDIIFEKSCGFLPITLVFQGEKLVCIIAGRPSEELWSAIRRNITEGEQVFLAYSGPMELLLKAICRSCPPEEVVEAIVILSERKVEAIQELVMRR